MSRTRNDSTRLSDENLDSMIRALPPRRPRTDLTRQAMRMRRDIPDRPSASFAWLAGAAAILLVVVLVMQFRETSGRGDRVAAAARRTRHPAPAWQTDLTHLQKRLKRVESGPRRWGRTTAGRRRDPMMTRIQAARTRAKQLKEDLSAWETGSKRTGQDTTTQRRDA